MSKITIEVKETNPFKLPKLTKQLEALSKLDDDTLTKLVELSGSESMIKMLKENWDFIKSM